MKSFGELSNEQEKRESDLLSTLMGETGLKKLADFEVGLNEHKSEMLFKITTELEDTEGALNQVEQLAQRLKKHLEQLKGLQQILSK